ncbi:hypothetical protein OZ410_02965 [Robiginitalea sp. M366]|uniref:hypothetical protein n=1 Tax=Robiginitalea aestuariiviva TaxID=3036903 RepID=UPI00240E2C8C|nr:hypothetical protein [Robiginitalea aestuariiviva]MDG1571259.1 hypothetical protein [Robiginitalea aestuariiviva]
MLLLSMLITFLTVFYEVEFDIDLTLLSIAIVFPLVFSIRGSFRRREKALQHFSQFRSALKTLDYYITSNRVLSATQKGEMEAMLSTISDRTIAHLGNNHQSTREVDNSINAIKNYLLDLGAAAPEKLKDRIYKYLNDLHEGFENLNAINIHRTPVSLKAYCLLFIYIFPLIYAPTIVYNTHVALGAFIVYFIVLLTQFILITLYNIQDQLEYPFDDDGLDDIKLENFRIDR